MRRQCWETLIRRRRLAVDAVAAVAAAAAAAAAAAVMIIRQLLGEEDGIGVVFWMFEASAIY